MTDFTVLIVQLEKIEGPDPDLDLEIAEMIYGRASMLLGDYKTYGWHIDGKLLWSKDLHYTSSLDAALTLVPREPRNEVSGTYDWQLESTNGGMTISARVGSKDTHSFADTPAVALCIAALKARSTL